MTPTWAVIVVAVASGLLGTLLTISHERAAELRTRMLNAADEFSTGTAAALRALRNSAGEVKRTAGIIGQQEGRFSEPIQAELDSANSAVDDVLAKQARVHLLFDSESDAGVASSAVVAHLGNMTSALDNWPHSVQAHENMATYSKNHEGVVSELEKFNRAARRALTATWRSRVWSRITGRQRT